MNGFSTYRADSGRSGSSRDPRFFERGSSGGARNGSGNGHRPRPAGTGARGARACSSRQGGRSLQGSGCREIDIVKEGSSFLFRTTVYKFHHHKEWIRK